MLEQLRGPAPGQETARQCTAIRALLVEDDDVDAKLIGFHAEAMADPRLTLDRAVSLAEARAMLAETRYDLCILDFWLGCESSLRLLADLERDFAALPAVVLTSLSTPDIRRICQQAGAIALLGKEALNPASLSAAVTSAVADGRSRGSSAPGTAPIREPEPARLVVHLVDLLNAAHTRASPSPEALRQRPSVRSDLCAMAELTETVRFTVFEQVLAARRLDPSAADPWTRDVAGFVVGAIASVRGVLDERGQTISLAPSDFVAAVDCEPATLFFLLFELVSRASQQSANDSRIEVSLHRETGMLAIHARSIVPSDASVGAVALGPLFTEVLRERGGMVTNARLPDGGLVLAARFRTLAGPDGRSSIAAH